MQFEKNEKNYPEAEMEINSRWVGDLLDQSALRPGDICFANRGAWILLITPGDEAVILSSLMPIQSGRHPESAIAPIATLQSGPLRRLTGELIVEPLYENRRCMFDPDRSGNYRIGHLFQTQKGLAIRVPVKHYYKHVSISDGSDISINSDEYAISRWRLLWNDRGKEREFFRFDPQDSD